MLKKLDHYGIRGPAHKLICSFLHRKQYVSVDGIQSEIESITYDVAQGSILGPLLFLLYTNDLNNSVNCLPRLFADHTCLIIDSPNLASLETEMNKDLANVYDWCIANKLSLNPSKSNHLIISPKQNILSPDVTLIVNNFNRCACFWPKGYQLGSLGKSHQNGDYLNRAMRKIVLPQESNLQPLDYRSTALPLELEKTPPRMLNFGYLNPATCLLYDCNNKSIKTFFDVCWPEF